MTRSDTRGQPLALTSPHIGTCLNQLQHTKGLGSLSHSLAQACTPTTSTTVQDNTVPLSLLDVRPHRLEPG